MGITLISAFAQSWDDAQRLPPTAGVELEEYGYAALQGMGEWNGAEALFCRRETTKTRVEDQHHNVWIPAVIEVLDVRPQELAGRVFTATQLGMKNYFDSGFLTMVLSDVLPEVVEASTPAHPVPDNGRIARKDRRRAHGIAAPGEAAPDGGAEKLGRMRGCLRGDS